MTPLAGPRSTVPPVLGGCTRTNYFNGMFITKEDLLTDQRNMRIKQQLQNRATGQGVVWALHSFRDGGADRCSTGLRSRLLWQRYHHHQRLQSRRQLTGSGPRRSSRAFRKGSTSDALVARILRMPGGPWPGPVHGDVCSSETTHCEMGRIRETARLRLVPPGI